MKKLIVGLAFILLPFIFIFLTGCESIDQRREIERQQLERALADPSLTSEQKTELIRQSMAPKPSYGSYRPVVDPASCKNCNYEGDLIQCQAIARDNTNYAGNTIASAAVGAGIGAVIGAVTGLDVGMLAAGGATGGAIGGLGNEALTVNQMIARCMQGRGYNVLR